MSAADARAFIREHDLGERVQKIASDAPDLTGPQRESLAAIFEGQDATKARPGARTSVMKSGLDPDVIKA